MIVALLIGAALNTAIITAREWECRTIKEIRLAPAHLAAIVSGKLLAGLTAALANTIVALLLAVGVFGLCIPLDRWGWFAGVGLLAALAAAGIGMAVGAFFHDYRILQPLLVVTFAGSFFASGGYASVATLPPFVRTLDAGWPVAYAFEALQTILHFQQLPQMTITVIGIFLTAAVGILFGSCLLKRRLSTPDL